jgi:hypothetical protein
MKENLIEGNATYPVFYRGKEYIFSIDRSGLGFCVCGTDAMTTAQNEDELIALKCLLGDEKAFHRMLSIDEEFSVDVQLSENVTRLVWAGWDELDDDDVDAGRLTPELIERERKIDHALRPILKRSFLNV